jgi:AcrR family transcriptional regulator
MGRLDVKESRRTQLIEATIDSLARHGFAEFTLAQVAKSARLSQGIVNFYFRSKEALIEGIVQEDIARQSAYFESAPDEDLPEVLTAFGRSKGFTGSGPVARHLALMLEIVAEAARNPKVRELVLSSQRRGHAALVKRLERASSSRWPAGELDVRLRLVSAILQGIVTQIVLDRRAPRMELLKRVSVMARELLTA